MKKRRNQIVAVQVEVADHSGEFTRSRFHTSQPIILPGGPHAEVNRLLALQGMEQFGGPCRARIIYRWRSWRHLLRWMDRGGRFGMRSRPGHA